MKLEKEIRERVNEWLEGPYDAETKAALEQLIAEEKSEEISDAFYKSLEFGTGGLRGVMGVGTNRINKYTLGAATQGLSNYLQQQYPGENIKVVIAHDNRNNAEKFAQIVADVFSANGIKVYFFEGLRPTPELSFAIRYLKAHSGVMLTASHNPKEYSGYKAYWTDGGQVVAPHDKNIIEQVNLITDVEKIKFKRNDELVEYIGEEVDSAFIESVLKASVYPNAITENRDLCMVFSPIHGAAVEMVPRALKTAGFTNLHLVEEQCIPDGNFPTVIYPNPEEEEAMSMTIKKAMLVDAELAMASDPDGDRVGVAVKKPEGDYVLLNGNQTCTLLFHYVMQGWKNLGKLKGREYIVKTIVTTYLIDKIADSFGITCHNTLTGFKFIGATMTQLEDSSQFITGGEESYGYLVGDHVRDKDAVVSCLLIAEMAAWYRSRGKSLYEALQDIYLEYGLYREKLISFTKAGKEGAEKISRMMRELRANPPATINGEEVELVRDYLSGEEHHIPSGKKKKLNFPSSNVLQFITPSGQRVSARPSGTEPKIKFYISVNAPLNLRGEYEAMCAALDRDIESIAGELGMGG
nr:phospho-sugar mutase [Saprospiraceae bacterium]